MPITVHKTSEVSPEAKVGDDTKIWHNCQILAGAQIGKKCTIGHNCLISSKACLGDGVKLESNIDVWDLVTLEDYVFVGPSVNFTNDLTPRAKYPKSKYPRYGKWLPTLVKSGASIGVNATIICGNTIGKSALVGGGSVVTKDVPDYALVIGVPAKIVGWICECGNQLNFEQDSAKCRFCGKCYKKRDSLVERTDNLNF